MTQTIKCREDLATFQMSCKGSPTMMTVWSTLLRTRTPLPGHGPRAPFMVRRLPLRPNLSFDMAPTWNRRHPSKNCAPRKRLNFLPRRWNHGKMSGMEDCIIGLREAPNDAAWPSHPNWPVPSCSLSYSTRAGIYVICWVLTLFFLLPLFGRLGKSSVERRA